MLERLEEIRENTFRYLEARIELFTLEIRGKLEEGVVIGIHGIVLTLLATMTTIFLFALLAAYLNEVLKSRYFGFLIVAGFFLLLSILWIGAKDYFKAKIRVIAYNSMKKNQEKKAQEKINMVEDLISQTQSSLTNTEKENS